MPHSTTWVNRAVKPCMAVLWLLLWQGAYLLVGEPLLLPSPMAVAERLFALLQEGGFYYIVGASFLRIFSGFLLALVLGCLLGACTAFSPLFYQFCKTPMYIIQATPVASFVILALVWIRGQNLSIFIAFLMVLPLVWRNVHTGFTQADPQLLELAQVYRLRKGTTLRQIYLPAVRPHLLSALRVGLGFGWKAGIAGEVIAIPSNAIGTQLYNAKVYLDTVDLFAWTAVIVLLSVLIEHGMLQLLPKPKPEVQP